MTKRCAWLYWIMFAALFVNAGGMVWAAYYGVGTAFIVHIIAMPLCLWGIARSLGRPKP